MNLRLYIICIAALFALGTPVFASGVPFLDDSKPAATVHGVTYAWDTLEPINDTVIDVNSTPPQSIVSKDGIYSFELAPGDYLVTARYYQNNTLTYSKETTFTIEDEGDYVLDLLLYPVSDNMIIEPTAAKINNPNDANPTEQTGTDPPTRRYLPIILTLTLLLGGGYEISRKQKNMKKNEFQEGEFNAPGFLARAAGKNTGSGIKPEFENIRDATSLTDSFLTDSLIEPADLELETAASNNPPLPTDLHKALDIIRGNKGKITQKDLRSKLNYSEVKVSLMLSELEKRGLIKKFKKGRENIVILINQEH